MQTSMTFPYLVLAPNYFKGQITLGTMFMLFRALGEVKGAFDWIIASYGTLTDFRATVDRLQSFLEAIQTKKESSMQVEQVYTMPEDHADDAFVASSITVRLPPTVDNRMIWKAASLAAKRGEFVLLTAPEGSGKSCFFRAVAGIWPYAQGTVHLQGSTLFVPQRSFIPQGSLKQALAYPDTEETFTDEQVQQALQDVGLKKVLDRNLADEANWQMVLSGGEQQRLALAHAVLRRPAVLFLDEATSALSKEGSLEVFQLLKKPGTLPEGAAVVTISHKIEQLRPVHDTVYAYSKEGQSWIKA